MAIIQRTMSEAIRWYDKKCFDVSRRYESVAAETVHGWLVDLLPKTPALALDVGAGTGRDVAWLASRSLEVVAVEPSGAMCTEAHGCILCRGSDGVGFFAWPRPGVAWVYPLI
jgi:SAM-dependent methyltransferase